MIKAKELLKRMTDHLSDWLVMRRNPEASNGGKVLLGIAQEVEEMQIAIQEYVDRHFISHYINKTHAIDYEYMRIHVGDVDCNMIKLLSPFLEVVKDMQLFESACIYSYYEKGYLYFKPATVSKGDTVSYIISDTTLEATAERVPIWNIFDEFALYVGIERLPEENNEHLLERILFQSQKPVNSSANGIQNAIANIIGSQPKDVIVEKIDESNCYQNDYTGEVLFEQLAEINRDVYRSKRWGVDYWHHDLDYVSYIPHQYDVAPGYFQDGIGDNNDLKVGVTRKDEIVHMEVKCYDKSEKAITEYHQKYPIETKTKLKLYKPEGEIDPIEVSALIEAGTLTDVTDSNLELTYNAIRSVSEKKRLIDVITTDNEKLDIKPDYAFIKTHHYCLKVSSKERYGSFAAKIELDNETLIAPQNDFIKDERGYLSHKNIALYVNQLSYFKEHIHFTHELDGFKLKPFTRSGRLILPLKNVGGKNIHYTLSEPGFDPSPENVISYKNFYKAEIDNSYISYTNTDPLFAIRQNANQIKFYIEGEAIVMIRSELGEFEKRIKDAYYETVSQIYEPIDYLIHVIPTDTTQAIKIKDIQYSDFTITNTLEHGAIDNGVLPDIADNTLTISVTTSMSMAPSIGFIYVGEPLDVLEYTTRTFEYTGQTIDYFGNGDVTFKILDLTDQTEYACDNNINTVTAKESVDIKLNLNQFKTIDNITSFDGGHVIKKSDVYYLRLEKQACARNIIVSGESIDYTIHYSLDDLVDKKLGARYYVSPVTEGFIEAIDYDMKVVIPKLDHLYGDYKVSCFEPYIPVFKAGSLTSQTQNAKAPIDTFYLKAQTENIYKAVNKINMYEEYKKDMLANKNFYPLLPYNEKLFYKITTLTDGASVLFYNKKKEEIYGTDYESRYSIDLKSLNCRVDFSLTERLKQQYQEAMLPIKLGKHVRLPSFVVNTSGDTLDLDEYLITTEEGIDVFYTSPQQEDIALDPSYIKTERFILNANGVKKLNYCRVHEILYCGFMPYTEGAQSTITEYKLTHQLGVLKFSDYFVKQNYGRAIYIHYTIQKPTMLILSTDKLYDIVPVTHDAYMLTATQFHNAPIGDYKVESEYFKTADYVTVQVQEPGYIATAHPKDGIIHIVESGPRDRIAIHKGFYYMNGEEYYMFGSMSDSHEEYKNDYVEAYEVNYMENGMMLHRRTENLVYNSAFERGPLAKLFATDFSELDNINYFKRLNACEQINLWQHCNMKMVLDKGLYGDGIHFAPIDKNVAHFIGMPIEQSGKDMTLSFWLTGDVSAVVYEQEKWEDEIHFTLSKTKRVIHFEREGQISFVNLPYNPKAFYYLCIKGEGSLDDLILCDQTIYSTSHHVKNIDKIFMPQFGSSKSNKQRFLFTHQRGFTGTMQMLPDGEIVPTSSMSYGYTQLLDKDWMQHCDTYKANYLDYCIVPEDQSAYAMSPIIKIESKDHVKEILIRANCISDKNIPLIVYTGNSEKSLRPVMSTTSDFIKINQIEDYIQVRCNLEETLYSLDISARYTEGAIPEIYHQNLFESELFDLGEAGLYEISKIKFKHFNHVKVFVRSGKTNYLIDDYKEVMLDINGNIAFNHQLGNSRYLQFKIIAPNSCQIEYFDIIDTGGREYV